MSKTCTFVRMQSDGTLVRIKPDGTEETVTVIPPKPMSDEAITVIYCLQLGGAKPTPLGGSFSRFFVDCGA
jgi:hypothetical protein